MYYTINARKQKVKELINNKIFIEYAQKQYEIYKRVSNFDGYDTFESYLEGTVFDLHENFSMLELIKRADSKTINSAIDIALNGI
jgi:hypothetical protein